MAGTRYDAKGGKIYDRKIEISQAEALATLKRNQESAHNNIKTERETGIRGIATGANKRLASESVSAKNALIKAIEQRKKK